MQAQREETDVELGEGTQHSHGVKWWWKWGQSKLRVCEARWVGDEIWGSYLVQWWVHPPTHDEEEYAAAGGAETWDEKDFYQTWFVRRMDEDTYRVVLRPTGWISLTWSRERNEVSWSLDVGHQSVTSASRRRYFESTRLICNEVVRIMDQVDAVMTQMDVTDPAELDLRDMEV